MTAVAPALRVLVILSSSVLFDQHVRSSDYSQYAHAHCNPDAELFSCFHLEPPEDLPWEQSQYEIEQCRVSRRTHAKDGIYLGRPACAFEVWIPSLGHRRTAKPEEERVQIHGDVGGDDEEPKKGLHITVHKFQQSKGEGGLTPDSCEYGKRPSNIAQDAEVGEIFHRDIVYMLPQTL